MKEAVIYIFYTDQFGAVHKEPQGKLFFYGGKLYFLADMTPRKYWGKYSGYSIAKQVLDAFSRAKIRPTIAYRIKKQNTVYLATLTTMKTKGVAVPYGGHEQYILPIQYWKTKINFIRNEFTGFPLMSVDEWLKDRNAEKTSSTAEKVKDEVYKPVDDPIKAWAKIKEDFFTKHPELRNVATQ